MLALSMTACGEQSADKVGKGATDGSAEQPGMQAEQEPSAAAKKLDQASKAIGEKTSQAAKALDDAATTALVKSALVAEPGLKALTIDVETTNGVVTLYGTTDSPENREKAVRVASKVEGVKTVEDKLVIVKGS
jgi:osmotically-inducible protein OsmY